jgi:hypothetical protein
MIDRHLIQKSQDSAGFSSEIVSEQQGQARENKAWPVGINLLASSVLDQVEKPGANRFFW